MNVLIFILAGYTIVIGVLDYMTTTVALQHGDVERNPIARFLQKHLGLPLSTFVSIAAVIFTMVPLCAKLEWLTYGFAAGLVAETVNVIKNFALLKKQKISLK